MTETVKFLLKKYTVLLGILLAFFAAFFGLSHLKKMTETKYLTAAAGTLCRTYPGFKDRKITVAGAIETGLQGLPFQSVLSASYEGNDAFVFFLPMTGKYGVYPAVFFYEQSIGCIFCGLAGVNAAAEQAGAYGITQAGIALQRKKIEALMENNRGSYEK